VRPAKLACTTNNYNTTADRLPESTTHAADVQLIIHRQQNI